MLQFAVMTLKYLNFKSNLVLVKSLIYATTNDYLLLFAAAFLCH
jgi:hypothetical protein